MEFFYKACDLKYPLGCSNLGYLYKKQNNFTKSYKFYKLACEYKDGYSCFVVGYFHKKGLGVSKDTKKAEYYYNKACSLGYREACQ